MNTPQIIHRIWFGGSMPEEYVENGKRWRELHPDWQFLEWTDKSSIPPLINQKFFDNAKKYYPHDWKRFKSDIFRLEILNIFGGLYTDTDSNPLQNIEPLIDDSSWIAARSPQHVKGHHPIANGFIACTPRHPFTRHLLRRMDYSLKFWGHKSLARSIGPWHVTREYETNPQAWPSVTILGPDQLYNTEWLTHTWGSGSTKKGIKQ